MVQVCQTSTREKADPEFKVILKLRCEFETETLSQRVAGRGRVVGLQSLVAQALIPAFKRLRRGLSYSVVEHVPFFHEARASAVCTNKNKSEFRAILATYRDSQNKK